MIVAREGLPFIGIAAAIALGTFGFALRARSWPLWLLAIVLTALALWVAYFFRDPERAGERGAALVISPADGRVIQISAVEEPAFLRGPTTRISIFMNLFSVHVNRYPVSGTVRYLHYNPGKFFNAAREKSSLENEQMSVGLETGRHRVLVRQIAGVLARRIVTYSTEGAVVRQGERFGMIRFGSRVDVYVPAGSRVRVAVGANTLSGTTVLAELP